MKKRFLTTLILTSGELFTSLTYAETTALNTLYEQEQILIHHAQTLSAQASASHTGKMPRAATDYKNTDKAKIDILYGAWQLSYNDGSAHSDALELESTLNDASFGIYGWDGRHVMSCFYEPNSVGTPYSYQCVHLVDSKAGIAQRYLFNLSGNTLVGKYYKGTVSQFLDAIKNNQLLDLMGSKGGSSDPLYDDGSKTLSIPKVGAFGKSYRAILVHEGNGLFRLKSALEN